MDSQKKDYSIWALYTQSLLCPSVSGHQLCLIDVDLTKTKTEVRNGAGQDRPLGPVQSKRCCRDHTWLMGLTHHHPVDCRFYLAEDSWGQNGCWQWVTDLRPHKYPVSHVYGLWLFGDSGASCIFSEWRILDTCWFSHLFACSAHTHSSFWAVLTPLQKLLL